MKKILGILIVSFLLVTSCSTRKNTFVNRTYHSITSKFNILYNGNVALEEGKKQLATSYKDNYWKVLPIEPLELKEKEIEVKIPENSETEEENTNKTPFEIAEEKAVKTIQKHGMNIYGEEHNPQTDDAYLLLGKARYYSQRFVPALEAFDYLLRNFQNEDMTNELRIWKAKTQIRLQNDERAIKTLENMIRYDDIDGATKEEAHTALAMAYQSVDSLSLTINQLKHATFTNYDKDQYFRNLMVLGQLYRLDGKIDSSNAAFQRIKEANKAPYVYKMNAYFEQAKNINDSTDYKTLQEELLHLTKLYEHKNFLDKLYYYTALMDFRDGNDSLALTNLTHSTHAPGAEMHQMSLAYEKQGDYFFNKAAFIEAGAYYDSLLAAESKVNTKRIRKIKRKRKSLDEVIAFEKTIIKNDSILNLVALSPEERTAFFEAHIEKLKEAERKAAIQKENQERFNAGGGGAINENMEISANGIWYFYNPQTLGFGKGNFQSVWGNRKLEDNWRHSNNSNHAGPPTETADQEPGMTDQMVAEKEKLYDINFYLDKIPTDPKEITQLEEARSDARYQLGLIYKEQFQKYDLAADRLEKCLAIKPIEKQILPAKYHLYKIYEITGNPKKEIIKQEILTEYPDSKLAQLIANPEELQGDKASDAEKHYEKVYCDYEFMHYQSVLDQCNEALKKYKDNPIEPKFELLKSYAVYKLQGKDAFKENLEFVVDNFPKTEEGIHAQEMLDFLNGIKKPEQSEATNNIVLPGRKSEKGMKGTLPNASSRTGKRNQQNPNSGKSRNTKGNRGNNRGNQNSNQNPGNNSGNVSPNAQSLKGQ